MYASILILLHALQYIFVILQLSKYGRQDKQNKDVR